MSTFLLVSACLLACDTFSVKFYFLPRAAREKGGRGRGRRRREGKREREREKERERKRERERET